MNLTAQARLREWARMVDDWRASGLTQRNWCKTHGMSPGTFKYRKGRVEAFTAGVLEQSNVEIIPLPDQNLQTAVYEVVDSNLSDHTIEIEFGGAVIKVNNNIAPDMLQILLGVVTHA